MSIAIVSALPSSSLPSSVAPTASANAAVDTTAQDAGLDFTRLLFGQITAALGASEMLIDKASATDDREAPDASLPEDETAQSGDTQNLLAILAQAPIEQRSANAPVIASAQNAAQGTATGLSMQLLTPRDKTLPVNAEQTPASDTLPPADVSSFGTLADSAANLLARGSANPAAEHTVSANTPPSMDASPFDTSADSAAKFAVSNALPAAVAKADAVLGDQPTAGTESTASPIPVAPTNAELRHHVEDAAPRVNLPTPLHDHTWNDDFAQKVTWLAGQHKQSAELTLNPPSMGNIEISLKLDRETSSATASFVSTNAEVRETIESALPRLREMLAGVGIELGQAQVSAESFRQSNGNEARQGNDASSSRNDMAILATDSPPAQGSILVGAAGRGLVDIFA